MKKVKSILSILLALLVVMGCSFSGFAAELTESEGETGNNTIETADVMGLTNKIVGTLKDAADVDVFSFEVADPSLITVNIEHAAIAASATTYFTVSVLNANGDAVVAPFKSAGKDAKTSSEEIPAEKGTYYIKVEMGQSHDSTIKYTLSASINTKADFEKEPNNDSSKATPLALSTSGSKKQYYGAISASNDSEVDVDYYVVDIPNPGAIYFYLYNGTAKKGNFKATLYSYKDVEGGATGLRALGSISITNNETSVMSPSVGVNGGRYILKIEGVSGSTGSYQTRVYYLSNANSEYEYNNEKIYANVIEKTSTTYGSIFDKADVDIYRFMAGANNNGYDIKLEVTGADKNVEGQWNISLVAPDGSTYAKADATNKKAATISTDKLKDNAAYYIVVEAGSTVNNGVYELKLTPKAPAKEEDKEDDKSFFEKIEDLPWKDFVKNFEGWFEKINIGGIISSITASIVQVITYLISIGG